MLFDLAGNVAVVTGSTRGIGLAIAERLAEHGCKVVISSRKQASCNAVAERINARYGEQRALPLAASISAKAELAAMVETTISRWKRVDVLVCNAASNPYYGPLSQISDEQFQKVLDNNVLANNWLVQLVQPGMIERKAGSIVIVSSIGGLRGSSVIGAYNVSKAADMQLARNLAVELGPHNIRVNCLAPGLIKTDFAKALWDDSERRRSYEDGTPLRRIGEPDEIAGAAVFLASRAGSFVTGQTIVIDGGWMVTGL